MAMRTVQAMGLHRDGQQFGLDPAAIEERRRIFWEVSREVTRSQQRAECEVFAYDTTVSLTMGRPRSGCQKSRALMVAHCSDGREDIRCQVSKDARDRRLL